MQYIQNQSEEDLTDIESQLGDDDLKEVFKRSISNLSTSKEQ